MFPLQAKAIRYLTALLFTTHTIYAQDACTPKCETNVCPQPNPPTQTCEDDPCCPLFPKPLLNAAYNYPARIHTNNPCNINFDFSFVFWQPMQENMELATTNTLLIATTGFSGDVVNMEFNYKPGFKLGIGGYFDHDGWDLHAQYTWFHNTNNQKTSVNQTVTQLLPMWGPGNSAIVNSNVYNNITEQWRLSMDIGDLDLGRWCYVSPKLTFRPSVGVRAAVIHQNIKVVNTNDSVISTGTDDIYTITARSRSWAIGTKAGLDANLNLGFGFRLYANSEADLLFTRYTKIANRCVNQFIIPSDNNDIHIKQSDNYAILPHFDIEFGFGWGSLVNYNDYHIDFSAGYGFQVFFNQNMFRHFNDDQMSANSRSPYGNLYIQGLTIAFKLDF